MWTKENSTYVVLIKQFNISFRQQNLTDDEENELSEKDKKFTPTACSEVPRAESRTKTISETSEESGTSHDSHETETDTEELTMAELELLKKLEEANRLGIIDDDVAIGK